MEISGAEVVVIPPRSDWSLISGLTGKQTKFILDTFDKLISEKSLRGTMADVAINLFSEKYQTVPRAQVAAYCWFVYFILRKTTGVTQIRNTIKFFGLEITEQQHLNAGSWTNYHLYQLLCKNLYALSNLAFRLVSLLQVDYSRFLERLDTLTRRFN